MIYPIVITSKGRLSIKKKPRVRRSLPYQGIARRALHLQSQITYDKEIDVSAVILSK